MVMAQVHMAGSTRRRQAAGKLPASYAPAWILNVAHILTLYGRLDTHHRGRLATRWRGLTYGGDVCLSHKVVRELGDETRLADTAVPAQKHFE